MSQQQQQVNNPNGGDNGRDGDGGGDGDPIQIQPSGTQSRLSTIRQTVAETIRPERITTLSTMICDCLTLGSTCCCTKNEDDIKTPEDSSNNREDSTTDQQHLKMSAARANLFKNTEPAQVATTTRYGTVKLTDSATQTDTTTPIDSTTPIATMTPIDTTTPIDSTTPIDTITQTGTSTEAGSSPSSSSGSSSRNRRCEVAGQTKAKKTLEDFQHKALGSLSTIGESVTSSESKDSKASGSEVGDDDKAASLASTENVEDDGKVEDGEPKTDE